MLGERTLAATHARIGTVLTMALPGFSRRERLTVVGVAVFPTLGDTIGLGTGADLAVKVAAAVALAVAVAAPPGESAARARPALALRSE